MKIIVNIFLLLLLFACEKESEFGYPPGIRVSDMETKNDCSLDECSDQRVRRLTANNVKGVIRVGNGSSSLNNSISYPLTFDSKMLIHICDLPPEFRQDSIEVKYSGDLIDACGIVDFGGIFIEEAYMLKLTKIKKI